MVAVIAGSDTGPTDPVEQDDAVPAVPVGHRVVSMSFDDSVPPLVPGNAIDLYLAIGGFGGTSGDVEALGEPGLVISTSESAFSFALPEGSISEVAEAIRDGDVLVVRR